jgi:hypothetical protein
VNGNYNGTSHDTDQITVIDFPTKVVQAGTFATVHTEDIQSVNGTLFTKTESYISKNNGQTIYLETYQYDQNSWSLIAARELISLSPPSSSPSPNIPEFPSTILIITFLITATLLGTVVIKRKQSRRIIE